jgi:transposase-like protein
MGQVLHKRATTTQRIRAEIQQSEESIAVLAKRLCLNPKTVMKWRKRDTVEDSPMGSKSLRTVLTRQDEEIICAFRSKTLLPLDDCYIALKDQIPLLSRSNLHRCLRRHGLAVLPKEEKEAKKKFKSYEIGYFHIDICEVRTAETKTYLYVAVDRVCKYVFAEVHNSATMKAAADFLENLIKAVPYKIHKILTDNGVQFTYELLNNKPKHKQIHLFDKVCELNKIEHRLTQFRHPWTNGQVERMNRTIKDATVKQYHYDTVAQLKQHLYDFINAYNYAKKLKILGFITPMEKIIQQWNLKPDLFNNDPIHYLMGLNS